MTSRAHRKNKSRLKIVEKTRQKRAANAQCSLEDGQYKSALFVPLTPCERAGDCIDYLVNSKAFRVCGKSGNVYSVRSAKKGIHLLLVDGDGLSDQETAYASRYCDVTILCSEGRVDDIKSLEAVRTNTSRVVLCYGRREHNREIRQALGKSGEDIRVVGREMLDDMLVRLQMHDTCSRPVVVPWEYAFHEDGGLVCEAFLKGGLVSKSFVCNGQHDMELAEVCVDGVSWAADAFLSNESVSYTLSVPSGDKTDESTEMQCNPVFDRVSSGSGGEDAGHEEYQSLRDVCAAEAVAPAAYRHLTFFANYKATESRCLKQHRRLFREKRAVLRFKPHPGVGADTRVVVLANMFCIETQNTVYNVYFSSKSEITQSTYLRADNGVRVFDFVPLLSESASRTVFCVQRSMCSGIMTFVGPLTVCTGRINIYSATAGREVSASSYICHGSLLDFGDRPLVEEKRLTGEPYKIHKRHCVIRNMFANKDDVVRFLKYGLRAAGNNEGIIKEPVGTHGMFKAYFSRPVKHGERVVMSMYRRVFPTCTQQPAAGAALLWSGAAETYPER